MFLSTTVIITLIINFHVQVVPNLVRRAYSSKSVSFDMACSVVNTFQWYLKGKIEIEGNVKEERHEDLGKRIALVPVAVLSSQSGDLIFSHSLHVHPWGSGATGTALQQLTCMVSLMGRTQDMSIDRFKNIRLCLANTLFSEGCRACVKGGELSTIDCPWLIKENRRSQVEWDGGGGKAILPMSSQS